MQGVQRVDSRVEQHLARGRQLDAAAGACEKHHVQLLFDLFDLIADGGGRQPDLVGGAREVQVTRGGFKRSQCPGTRKHARHYLQAKFDDLAKLTRFLCTVQTRIVAKLDDH
ncbi:hypothetical protein D3C87_1919150 [compost metagenome]